VLREGRSWLSFSPTVSCSAATPDRIQPVLAGVLIRILLSPSSDVITPHLSLILSTLFSHTASFSSSRQSRTLWAEKATTRTMSAPKSLRPKYQPSGTSSQRRKPCRMCNNLDPRGHASSVYQNDSLKDATTNLTLTLDALSLSRTKPPTLRGCRFCNVLTQALDAFFDDWRGSRQRINVEIREKGSVKVGIDGTKWKGQLIEIFSGAGRDFLFPIVVRIITFHQDTFSPTIHQHPQILLESASSINTISTNEHCVASRAPWPTLGTAHRIPTDAGSDFTFDFARRCIQDCLTNPKHTACKPPSNSGSALPKRLLDVGRVAAPIRLIDTQS
jgi:hypothetical protein